MAFTFGFYNSLNGDRTYDSSQVSGILDALIVDGVIQSHGNTFATRPGQGMSVLVDTGLAWFNSTWNRNSAVMQVDIPPADISFSRWYAVVIQVNRQVNVRWNDIIPISGELGINPTRPSLIRSEHVNQYAVCYILVPPRTTQITASMIHIVVGLSETPFATGVLEGIDIDILFERWENQWYHFFNNQSLEILQAFDGWKKQWAGFFGTHSSEILDAFEDWKKQWQQFFDTQLQNSENWRAQWNHWFSTTTNNANSEMEAWRNDRQGTFDEWFAALQAILDGDIAANLTDRVLQHENTLVSGGGVHGIRFDPVDGTLQVLIDSGWIIVGSADSVTGYTARYFDVQKFTALDFDFRQYTAHEFDTIIRMVN